MASGTGFYLYAIVIVVFIGAILLIFQVTKFGDLDHRSYILKLKLSPDQKNTVNELCKQHCRHYAVVSISRGSEDADSYEQLRSNKFRTGRAV